MTDEYFCPKDRPIDSKTWDEIWGFVRDKSYFARGLRRFGKEHFRNGWVKTPTVEEIVIACQEVIGE